MKKLFAAALVASTLSLPALGHAGYTCFQNEARGIFWLDVKPKCKATSSKAAAIVGLMKTSGAVCQGSRYLGIHGVCFGVEGDLHVSFTSERLDHTNPDACSLRSWNLLGNSLESTLTGSLERSTGVRNSSVLTPIACPVIPK